MTNATITSSYNVYTRAYDEVIHATAFLNELEGGYYGYREKLQSFLISCLAGAKRIDKIPGDPKRPVTFLFDCSGSMRGEPIAQLLPALLIVGDKMAEQGRPFEILGHTTRAWKGGNAREEWIEAGRPRTPGRLNELRHIVFKGHEDNWEGMRLDLALGFKDGLLKENIDGEALEWGAERSTALTDACKGTQGGIVMITDGSPIDDATLSANPESILKDHLSLVKAQVRERMPFSILSMGYPDKGAVEDPHAVRIPTGLPGKRAESIDRLVQGLLKTIEHLEAPVASSVLP
jgi:cobalamin biosynthesis protein CobT